MRQITFQLNEEKEMGKKLKSVISFVSEITAFAHDIKVKLCIIYSLFEHLLLFPVRQTFQVYLSKEK